MQCFLNRGGFFFGRLLLQYDVYVRKLIPIRHLILNDEGPMLEGQTCCLHRNFALGRACVCVFGRVTYRKGEMSLNLISEFSARLQPKKELRSAPPNGT